MGVKGLFASIKAVCKPSHIKEFSGQTVGVDASSWLFKGGISCSRDLCLNQPTTRFIDYCIHRVDLLLYNNVTPYLVFDGDALPMKKLTHENREKKRTENKDKAIQLLQEGKVKQAEEYFARAVDVTPDMEHALIKILRGRNIDFVVAPYEADAQLAKLYHDGNISAIITEDSDLVAYGAGMIIYKMSRYGECEVFDAKDIQASPTLNFPNAESNQDMIIYMSVLSGCDFFPGIPSLGIKKAHDLLKLHRTIHRTLNIIKFDPKYKAEKGFEKNFWKAYMVFRHQSVYDCKLEKTVHLNEIPDVLLATLPWLMDEGFDFLGQSIDGKIAKQVAYGELAARSKLTFPDTHENETPAVNIDRYLGGKSYIQQGIKRKLFHAPDKKSKITSFLKSMPSSSMNITKYSSLANLQYKAPRKAESAEQVQDIKARLKRGSLSSAYLTGKSIPSDVAKKQACTPKPQQQILLSSFFLRKKEMCDSEEKMDLGRNKEVNSTQDSSMGTGRNESTELNEDDNCGLPFVDGEKIEDAAVMASSCLIETPKDGDEISNSPSLNGIENSMENDASNEPAHSLFRKIQCEEEIKTEEDNQHGYTNKDNSMASSKRNHALDCLNRFKRKSDDLAEFVNEASTAERNGQFDRTSGNEYVRNEYLRPLCNGFGSVPPKIRSRNLGESGTRRLSLQARISKDLREEESRDDLFAALERFCAGKAPVNSLPQPEPKI